MKEEFANIFKKSKTCVLISFYFFLFSLKKYTILDNDMIHSLTISHQLKTVSGVG